MIAGLQGTIHSISPDAVLVNVAGVIYRVLTCSRTGEASGGIGNSVELHTHLVVREDAMTLFGFLSEDELLWFQTLIGINGVGPRLACAVLSRFDPGTLADAISSEEVDLLSTVPGIGKRTAARIVLDLRGKLPDRLDIGVARVTSSGDADAVAALQALGFSTSEILTVLSTLPAESLPTTEDRVYAALKILGTT